ncbi:MAG: flagellar assembly protein FliH, partial [Treponema sp.]|nr:flagellar assembly protein FliH [Treponema sp.]MCL2237983.1 flagellar assembly protein FliH [Treponema sp.]
IGNPTSFPEMAQFATIEEPEEALEDFDEFTGPTADDLRREAEMFKSQWEDEKERMFASARAEAESIVTDAQKAAFAEVKRQTDEGQVIKQQAIDEAEKIIADAQGKVRQLENEIRQTLEAERNDARTQGKNEGKDSGFAEGKAEVDRLIERTQTVLERAQDKRGEILSETEKEIVDLVLLITRKVIKVISENQRDIIIYNVTEALRKVKAKGSVIIRVNLADLELATEHKQDFINIMEGKGSVNIAEDSSVDPGGCIIETDFGEIDARIASQLAELENKILEISPIGSRVKENTPPPIVKTASLNSELAAASTLLQAQAKSALDTSSDSTEEDDLDSTLSHGAEAALTASAALAALATMATKGKRESDRKVAQKLENMSLKRKTDP